MYNWQMGQYAAAAAQAQAQATNLYAQHHPAAQGAMPMMGMGAGNTNLQQQQQMYQWYYNSWQQPGMMPQSGMQQSFPAVQQQYPPLPPDKAINPAPPVEPPADAKPPLPPEPPPEEPGNGEKMPPQPAQNELKRSVAPPPPPEEPPPAPANPQTSEADAAMKAQMDEVMKEETEFQQQYAQWKQQYYDWQDQNKNHPNKEQFAQYLAQWKQYEQQMEERRLDIEARKKGLEMAFKSSCPTSVMTPQQGLEASGSRGPQGPAAAVPTQFQGGPSVAPDNQRPPQAPPAQQFQGGPQPGGPSQFQGGRGGPGGPNVRFNGPGQGYGPSQGFGQGAGFNSQGQGQFRPLPGDGPPGPPGPSGALPDKGSSGDFKEGGEDDMELDEENNQNAMDSGNQPQFAQGPMGFHPPRQGPNFRGPGPQNFGGRGGAGPPFSGARGGPAPRNFHGGPGGIMRGAGPQNFRGGQNFHSARPDKDLQYGAESGQIDESEGRQDLDSWSHDAQFQRGGFQGGRGMMGRGGPDSRGARGAGPGFGGRGKMLPRESDLGPDEPGTEMGNFAGSIDHTEAGRGGFRGRGSIGPDSFRGRGGPPLRGRGAGPQGFVDDFDKPFQELNYDDQNYHEDSQDFEQQFQGPLVPRGRGGPGMMRGRGQLQGRGGPSGQGRGGAWQGTGQFENVDFIQDEIFDERADNEMENDPGLVLEGQFSTRGRGGGPPRGRGQGFDSQRGGFSGPPGPRGGYNGPDGMRGGFSGPPGQRGGYNGPESLRGGFSETHSQRGGFNGPEGQRGGLSGPQSQRGRFSGPEGQRGGFNGPRGGFSGTDSHRGGFIGSKRQQGGFDGPDEFGGLEEQEDAPEDYDGFSGQHGQRDGPYNGPEGNRGLRGPQGERGGYNGPEGHGGFSRPQGQRGGYNGPEGQRDGFSGPQMQRGGFSGSEGHRGGFSGPQGQRGGFSGPEHQRGVFNGPRGQGEHIGPEGQRGAFSGPLGQRGRGQGLLGAGSAGRGRGRPPSLLEMEFDEGAIEERLTKDVTMESEHLELVEDQDARAALPNQHLSKPTIVAQELEPQKSKDLGLGNKLPMSFGKGGGFDEEQPQEEEEGGGPAAGPVADDLQGSAILAPPSKPVFDKELGFGNMLPLSFGKGGGFDIEEEEPKGWAFGQGRGSGRGLAPVDRGRGRGGRGGLLLQQHQAHGDDVAEENEQEREESGRGRGLANRARGRDPIHGERGRGRGGPSRQSWEGPVPPVDAPPEVEGDIEPAADDRYFYPGRGRGAWFEERGRGRGRGFHPDNLRPEDDLELQRGYPEPGRGVGFRGRGRGRGHPDDLRPEDDLELQRGYFEPGRGVGFRGRGRGHPDDLRPEDDLELQRGYPELGRGVGFRGRGRGHLPYNVVDRDFHEAGIDVDARELGRPWPPYPEERFRDRPDPYGREYPPRLPYGPDEDYKDPYSRSRDPFGYRPYRDREHLARDPYLDPYRPPPVAKEEEKPLFVPAKSIDYGHGPAAVPLEDEDSTKPKVKLEVIDYGHGTKSDDPLADLDREADRFERERSSRLEERLLARVAGGSPDRREDKTLSQEREIDYRINRDVDARLPSRDSWNREHRGERGFREERVGADRYGSRSDFPDRSTYDRKDTLGRSPVYREGREIWPERDDRLGYPHRREEGKDQYERDRSMRSERRDSFGKDVDRDRLGSDRDLYERDREPLTRDRESRLAREEWNSRDRERDPIGRDREKGMMGRDRDPAVDYVDLERHKRDPFDREPHSRDWEGTGKERERSSLGAERDQLGGWPKERSPLTRDRDLLAGEREQYGRGKDRGDQHGRPEKPRMEEAYQESDDRRPDSGPDWPDHGTGRPDVRPRDFDRVRDVEPSVSKDRSPRDISKSSREFLTPSAPSPKVEKAKVEDIICLPGRTGRPPHIVVIVRGLPGSGKTYVSKLLREKEVANGGAAPRMLSLDDYFMVEVEKKEMDPDTGKKVTRKVMEYEYEQDMEEAYLQSLFKSFKKTVDDGLFPFIIVDAINEKVKSFEPFWSYAKSKGFQVYLAEVEADVPTCINRNIHKWTEYDIEKVKGRWEPAPEHFLRLDIRWLLQEDSITEVEMEDQAKEEKVEEGSKAEEKKEDEDEDDDKVYKKSKWELDTSEVKLDKLDGLSHGMHKSLRETVTTMEEYLQLSDDYSKRKSTPGKKRVRWADLEEKKEQDRRRDLGFVVGQTQEDWNRITDDKIAEKALTRTKYI